MPHNVLPVVLPDREYKENDYILKWDDGRPLAPDCVTHRFSDLLEKVLEKSRK